MRHPLLAPLVLAGTLTLLSCGGESPVTTSPANPLSARSAVVDGNCLSSYEIYALIAELFPAGEERTAAEARFNNIMALLGSTPPGPDTTTAQAHTLSLIEFTLKKYSKGQLIGGLSALTRDQAVALVNALLCFAGMDPILTAGALGPDGAWAIISGTSPPTYIVTGTMQAGVFVDSGSVQEPHLVTVSPNAYSSPGPLLTGFDQYPLFYDYNIEPYDTFDIPVIVGVCLAPDVTVPEVTRLRLAHNVPHVSPIGIEVLPYALATFLDCHPLNTGATRQNWLHNLAQLFLPSPLMAAAAGGWGTAGSASNLSPFGAVDTLGHISANSAASQNAPVGVAVYTPPSVRVTSFNGVPMPGVTVTFEVTGGGGSITGATQVTDASGIATVGSWTLGATAGTNTLTATATPPVHRTGFQGNPVTFTATANPPAKVGYLVQPTGTTAGSTITPAVQVAIQDAYGNLVSSSTAPVTLSLGTAPAGATLGGTATVNAVGGVATFSDLVLTTAGTYTLVASSPALLSATSASFTISPATAAQIAAAGGDGQTALAGTAVTTPPSVKVSDAYGNGIAGVSVTFVAANGGSVTGASQATDASGIATVGSWTLAVGVNYLYATAAIPLTGNPVTFTATGTTAFATLCDCPPSQGAGDPLTRAFFTKLSGRWLSQVDLYLSSNGSASSLTPYTIQLTARQDGYNGPVIAQSTVTVWLRGNTSENLLTHFVFPTTAVKWNSTVAFSFNVLTNPDGAGLFFNVGKCGVGDNRCKTDCPIIETVDASGTTSTFYRKGIGARIIGGT